MWRRYIWNPSTYACECDKDCGTSEYWKDCECMKSLADDLEVKMRDWSDMKKCSNQF